MFARLSPIDLTFMLAAIAFNLFIAAIFIAQKLGQERWLRVFGVLWLCLAIPLAAVFASYWLSGNEMRILLYFGFIFVYMFAELLLDYVFQIDFRSRAGLHIPYIILEYIALFSLIAIAFSVDRAWGTVVAICFWILMGSLVFLYWDRIFKRKKP